MSQPFPRFRRAYLVIACVLMSIGTSLSLADSPSTRSAEVGSSATKPALVDTPEAVAQRATAALREGRVADFALDMHPQALKEFREVMLDVSRAAKERGEEEDFLEMFKGVKSLDQLSQLDDAQTFVAFLDGMMDLQPRVRSALRGTTIQVVGHVAEGTDLVHVVYRGTVKQGDFEVTKLTVMSLQRTEDGHWAMLMTDDIKAMAATLKRQMGSR